MHTRVQQTVQRLFNVVHTPRFSPNCSVLVTDLGFFFACLLSAFSSIGAAAIRV